MLRSLPLRLSTLPSFVRALSADQSGQVSANLQDSTNQSQQASTNQSGQASTNQSGEASTNQSQQASGSKSLEERRLEFEIRRWEAEQKQKREEREEEREQKREEREQKREEKRWERKQKNWDRLYNVLYDLWNRLWPIGIAGISFYLLDEFGPEFLKSRSIKFMEVVPSIQEAQEKSRSAKFKEIICEAGRSSQIPELHEDQIKTGIPDKIADFLRSDPHKVLILDGPRGSGKSWSLDEVLHNERQANKAKIYRIKLTGIKSSKDFLLALCEAFGFKNNYDTTVALNLGGYSMQTHEVPAREFDSLSLFLSKIDRLLVSKELGKEEPLIIAVDDLEAISLENEEAKESFGIFMRFCRSWAKDDRAKVIMASSSTYVSRTFATAEDNLQYFGDLEEKAAITHLTNCKISEEDAKKVVKKIGTKAADIRTFCKKFKESNDLAKSINQTLDEKKKAANLYFEGIFQNSKFTPDNIRDLCNKVLERQPISSIELNVNLTETERFALQGLLRAQVLIHDKEDKIKFSSEVLQNHFLQHFTKTS